MFRILHYYFSSNCSWHFAVDYRNALYFGENSRHFKRKFDRRKGRMVGCVKNDSTSSFNVPQNKTDVHAPDGKTASQVAPGAPPSRAAGRPGTGLGAAPAGPRLYGCPPERRLRMRDANEIMNWIRFEYFVRFRKFQKIMFANVGKTKSANLHLLNFVLIF